MDTVQRQIVRLALPAAVENILQTLVGFADTVIIAQLGLAVVTAVGASNVILSVYLAVYLALGVGGTALISRHLGAGEIRKARQETVQVLRLALLIGLALGFLSLVFGRLLLTAFGLSDSEYRLVAPYLSLLAGLTVLGSLSTVLGSILRAQGDTQYPMLVAALTNVFNVGADYFLIFGIGSFTGFGLFGNALGTVLARLVSLILLLRKLQRSQLALSRDGLLQKSSSRELIRLALPAAGERLVMRLGQVFYMSLVMSVSSLTFASHSIAGSIESFVYMPAYGLATAASVLIGQALGERNGEKIRQVGFWSAAFAVLILSFFALFLFFGGAYFAAFFTRDPEAVRQVQIALQIDAFAQPALAVGLILAGALQGLGDTKTPLFSTSFGMWGIRVTGVYLLGNLAGLGIAGIWLVILLDIYMRAVFLTVCFCRRCSKLLELGDMQAMAEELSS